MLRRPLTSDAERGRQCQDENRSPRVHSGGAIGTYACGQGFGLAPGCAWLVATLYWVRMSRPALLSSFVALLLVAGTAAAQLLPLESLPERPIRLEGYWGLTHDEPDVIGDVTVSVRGRSKRRFGITAVQAYKPEEEGIQIFRFTSDHPVTLLLRGDEEAVRRFFEAPHDRKVVAFGTYNRGSGTFVLGSVDIGDRRRDARR
jgi:hypothetical protein